MIQFLTNKRGNAPGNVLVCATVALALSGASLARAQTTDPECSTLPAPIIYGRGGSAADPLIARLAVDLAGSSKPLTVVYDDSGACNAMESLVNGVQISGGGIKYWIKDGTGKTVRKTCTVTTPVDATWGSMAQLATACQGIDALPADVSDTISTISGFSLIVPKGSTEQVISAEALYFIYGFGVDNPKYQVAPWTVAGAIGTRSNTSAAEFILAKAIGIPPATGLGSQVFTDVKTNQGAVDFIASGSQAAVDNPSAALAFCSSETLDAGNNRSKVRALAFQAKGQKHGYWADSNAETKFDKINLRQGRYDLWNPEHFFAKLDKPNGKIADPDVKRWIEYITGQTAEPDGLSFLDQQIEVGNIPDCAMQVARDGDVGPLQSYQPKESCNCYYETKATGSKPDACKECATEGRDSSCPTDAPVCHHGYCEVQ